MIKQSLKSKVEQLVSTDKSGDKESIFINNVFVMMHEFHMSYDEIMNMPFFAFNEMLKFYKENINKENKTYGTGKHTKKT